MWPNSPFARPVSSFERPVPLVSVDPCDNPDVMISVRHEWIPYILGSLKQLVLQTTWATTDPDVLWLVQQRAMTLLDCVMQMNSPTVCPPITEMELELAICEQLRFQDGKLQGLCCGVWSNIDGQPSQGVGGPGQPGGGTPQPAPGGGSECYSGQLQANGTWLVPTVVSSGDTVELTDATGASQDGSVSPWRCPNGQTFFAGACVGIGGVQTGDPASAVDHMRLVLNIGGTYYDAMGGALTVPGGVTNAQVIVQVNDSTLSDNSGSFQFKVCVTNNTTPSWAHDIDLTLSPAGFVAFDGGDWTPGVGLQSTDVSQIPNNGQQLAMQLDFGFDVAVTALGIVFDTVVGSHGGTLYEDLITVDSGGTGTVRATIAPPTTGSGQVLNWTGALTIRKIQLIGVMDARPNPNPTDGKWTIYTLHVEGQGFDPFV